jgi:uncharacterized MAPEG superfamily protein
MLFAHWMLLVASFLPIIAVSFAKSGKAYDNSQPRVYAESLAENTLQRRMVWAEANSWEALMMFAPAVLLATFLKVDTMVLNLCAGGFIVARIVYLICYAKNLASARSAVWSIGLLFILGLYVAAAMA